MSFELEKALRQALKREEPVPDFTERLLARIAIEGHELPPTPVKTENTWWRNLLSRFQLMFQVVPLRWAAVGALTVVLLLAPIAVQRYRAQQREIAEGEYAKEQVMLALQIASAKLNAAQR